MLLTAPTPALFKVNCITFSIISISYLAGLKALSVLGVDAMVNTQLLTN